MDERTPKTIENIRRVAQETGTQRKFKSLSEELNRQGITSPRGSAWTPGGLFNFCTRHGLFKGAPAPKKGKAEPRPVALATQDTADITRPEVLQLDPDTIGILREVAQWWKVKGAKMAMQNASWEGETAEPAYRPNFPGTRRNTGIRINARLLQDALEKAQTPAESVKTGGGLSPLIERLLWQYLGFDSKYLAVEM
ncbi:MAG: hypothetical protein ACLQPD_33030 [Desulfomonilaceae bacterium]